MKKIIPIVAVLFVITLALYWGYYKDYSAEITLKKCINKILNSHPDTLVNSDTKGRGKFPILNGSTTAQSKKNILKSISKQCDLIEIQDFIEVSDNPTKSVAFINFSIDEANAIVTIKGVVKNKNQRDTLLHSFTDSDSISGMTLTENISINPRVKKENFTIPITLLLASIDAIKLSNITVKDQQIILKGLVRDKHQEAKTLNTINQLFADEFSIINDLELVVPLDSEIQGIQFDLAPLPKLQKPDAN